MTPSHLDPPRPGRASQVLASFLRIQSLVALIVGGTLALGFALGGYFGRVAFSLGLMVYGLGWLAYATRARDAAPATAVRHAPTTKRPTAGTNSGRVIPIAGSRRPEPAATRDELDQLAGR